MKSKRTLAIAASMLIVTALTGCANLFTVERTTKFEDGTAIHLDAQQRLVLFTEKEFTREKDTDKDKQKNTDEQEKTDKEKYYTKYTYCAEPNPDAMSSYAASLGLSALDPSKSDVSLVHELQSATGNIGLRTQSVTLMRDALYRICEAYNNGGLDKKEVNKLFRRSQNLTAVVLAIEQLTGAVKPNSTIWTPKGPEENKSSVSPNPQSPPDPKTAKEIATAVTKEIATAVKEMVKTVIEEDDKFEQKESDRNFMQKLVRDLLKKNLLDPNLLELILRSYFNGEIQELAERAE